MGSRDTVRDRERTMDVFKKPLRTRKRKPKKFLKSKKAKWMWMRRQRNREEKEPRWWWRFSGRRQRTAKRFLTFFNVTLKLSACERPVTEDRKPVYAFYLSISLSLSTLGIGSFIFSITSVEWWLVHLLIALIEKTESEPTSGKPSLHLTSFN